MSATEQSLLIRLSRRLALSWAFGLCFAISAGPLDAALPTTGALFALQVQDAQVWVNRTSRVYHCAGTRYYGNTKRGEYMLESQASKAGMRPAYGRSCSSNGESPREPATSAPESRLPMRSEQPSQSNGGARVWVNTKSGVYHCPGSRYYGNTKSGRYMTEDAATSGGNRPAFGKNCR